MFLFFLNFKGPSNAAFAQSQLNLECGESRLNFTNQTCSMNTNESTHASTYQEPVPVVSTIQNCQYITTNAETSSIFNEIGDHFSESNSQQLMNPINFEQIDVNNKMENFNFNVSD